MGTETALRPCYPRSGLRTKNAQCFTIGLREPLAAERANVVRRSHQRFAATFTCFLATANKVCGPFYVKDRLQANWTFIL